MDRIAYTVTATLPDARIADEYVAWLEDGHVDAVIEGGAHSAMIVRLDPPTAGSHAAAELKPGEVQVETRYVFAGTEAYERYVAQVAPVLREDGLRRFPPARGVRFSRRTGRVV